jgi:hypothetical protein
VNRDVAKALLSHANDDLEHARKRAYNYTLAVITDMVRARWPGAYGIGVAIGWETGHDGRPYPIAHLDSINCHPGQLATETDPGDGEVVAKEARARSFQELAEELLDYLPELVDVMVEPEAGINRIRLEE